MRFGDGLYGSRRRPDPDGRDDTVWATSMVNGPTAGRTGGLADEKLCG